MHCSLIKTCKTLRKHWVRRVAVLITQSVNWMSLGKNVLTATLGLFGVINASDSKLVSGCVDF